MELIRTGGAYAKPFYWAPFQLYTRRIPPAGIDFWRDRQTAPDLANLRGFAPVCSARQIILRRLSVPRQFQPPACACATDELATSRICSGQAYRAVCRSGPGEALDSANMCACRSFREVTSLEFLQHYFFEDGSQGPPCDPNTAPLKITSSKNTRGRACAASAAPAASFLSASRKTNVPASREADSSPPRIPPISP